MSVHTSTELKVTALQQKLIDADDRLRAINKKRREMFVEEEDAAKQDKAKAENAIIKEAALEILRPIKNRLREGKQVTGTRQSSTSINIFSKQWKNIDTPSADFVITNVHIGRKHYGVHVRYGGGRRQHWVSVLRLNSHDHALHNGLQYRHIETAAHALRKLIEGGEA